MATAAQISVNVKEVGVATVIPDNDVARLMYYLRCITVCVKVDILDKDLVDYRNYWWLSPARCALVLEAALLLSPDKVIDKVFFQDDDSTIISGTSQNEFCNISVACDVVSLQQDIFIAGRAQNVNVVMFFKSSWLDENYRLPFARTVLGSQHCAHCAGKDGICACDECPRNSESQCQPLLGLLIDSLSSTSISSTPRPSTPTPPADSSAAHQCICDGCPKRPFEGRRYRCTVCDDYDLCETCYKKNVHHLSHRFMQFDRPGSLPVVLAPRTSPPATAASPAHRLPQPTPAAPKPNSPSYTSAIALSPYFYNDMTVAELKEYLKGQGVVTKSPGASDSIA
jgi:hypothetical protein